MGVFLKITRCLLLIVAIFTSATATVNAEESSVISENKIEESKKDTLEANADIDRELSVENSSDTSVDDKDTSLEESESPIAEEKPKKKLFALPKISSPAKWFAKKKETKSSEQDEKSDEGNIQAATDRGESETDDTKDIGASKPGDPKEATADIDGLVNEHEKVVKLYRVSSAKMARAQAQIAEAIGLKEEAALMRAEADALEDDSAESAKGQGKQIKSYTKTSKKTNKAISKRLDEKQQLDQEQQKKFGKGMLLYARGAIATNHFAKEMRPFYRSMLKQGRFTKGASIETLVSQAQLLFNKNARSLGTGLYIAKSSPKVIYAHSQTISKLKGYAKSQQIDVPEDASKELDGFSEESDWKSI